MVLDSLGTDPACVPTADVPFSVSWIFLATLLMLLYPLWVSILVGTILTLIFFASMRVLVF